MDAASRAFSNVCPYDEREWHDHQSRMRGHHRVHRGGNWWDAEKKATVHAERSSRRSDCKDQMKSDCEGEVSHDIVFAFFKKAWYSQHTRQHHKDAAALTWLTLPHFPHKVQRTQLDEAMNKGGPWEH